MHPIMLWLRGAAGQGRPSRLRRSFAASPLRVKTRVVCLSPSARPLGRSAHSRGWTPLAPGFDLPSRALRALQRPSALGARRAKRGPLAAPVALRPLRPFAALRGHSKGAALRSACGASPPIDRSTRVRGRSLRLKCSASASSALRFQVAQWRPPARAHGARGDGG